MSVLAKDRRQSPLRVMTHWMEVRIEFNRLFVFNFGYDKKKVVQVVRRAYNIYEATDQMKPERLDLFGRVVKMNEEAALKILEDSRKFLIDAFRQVEDHIYIANTIYPTTPEELSLRRCHQDEALGICFSMLKELEFIMRSMPVHAEKYPRYITMLNDELNLLKSWRASNNKFNKVYEKKSSRRNRTKRSDTAEGLPQCESDSSDTQATPSDDATNPDTSENVAPSSPPQANSSASPNRQGYRPRKYPYSQGYGYQTGFRR